MRMTDGRINHVSRLIADALIKGDFVEGELDNVTKEAKKGLVYFCQDEDAIDGKVRGKIESLKKNVPEGSAEWDILYRKYYNEEIDKL